MKTSPDPLDRLLRAAARAPRTEASALPFALESRVLAGYGRGASKDELAFVAGLFRRAALLAALVMILAIGWSWLARIDETPSKTTLPSYAFTVQLRP